MRNAAALLGVIAMISGAASCGKGFESAADLEETAASVTDVLQGADEQLGNATSIASLDLDSTLFTKTWGERVADFLIPNACAAGCTTVTFANNCAVNGTRSRTFNGCTTAAGRFQHNGTVNLAFFNSAGVAKSNCALTAGDYVLRTVSRTVSGKRGGNLSVTSTGVSSYDNASFGAGQKLTRTTTGATLQILGMNRTATKDGVEIFNISTKTTDNLVFEGTSRVNRVLKSGTIAIYHNIAQYTMTVTPSNVAWQASCDTPVSGTLTGTLTGGRSGTVTITYTGCGTYTITRTQDDESETAEGSADTSDAS